LNGDVPADHASHRRLAGGSVIECADMQTPQGLRTIRRERIGERFDPAITTMRQTNFFGHGRVVGKDRTEQSLQAVVKFMVFVSVLVFFY
jgi:hypothetical protein